MGQAPCRAVLVGVLAAVALSGCGGGGDSSKQAATSNTPSASPTASPTPATKYDQFLALTSDRGIQTVSTTREEADSVAANVCDNTDADMDTLIGGLNALGGTHLKEEEALVDTYCSPKKNALVMAELRVQQAAAAASLAAANAAAEAAKIKPTDFTIGIKILKQSCFGSAGCNVTYRIDPKYVGTGSVSTGSYEVTYTLTGDEDGPKINTFTIEDGTASYDQEESASTKSSKTVLTAKVTEVSKK